MTGAFPLVEPRIAPPLEPGLRPAALANRAFRAAVKASGRGVPLRIALERDGGLVSVYDTPVWAESEPEFAQNLPYVERIVKTLLWARGGFKVTIAGPKAIGDHLRRAYAPGGAREFDHAFMGKQVYERPFVVESTSFEAAPAEREAAVSIGRHLDGCRIGVDLGGTDRKVSAVVDGEPVYSEEVIWHPKVTTDPEYHAREIRAALTTAASKMPRVDAIGVSAAGIYVDNRVMVASLFRKIPTDLFDSRIKNLFLELGREWGVPLAVCNDGDVTALAGSMSLGTGSVLGVAMGTSEAGGWVDARGNITGWLNELAFVPFDLQPGGPKDEDWSGDLGCGVSYFSQDGVARLCPRGGLAPEGRDNGERLAAVQELLRKGDERVPKVFETIGVCFGYALAHYADIYDAREVLVLGRVTSGQGGDLIVEQARKVLEAEFPALAERMSLRLPDEKSKRVGQSIAAASLPERRHAQGGKK
jgi:predicted NBD/HSP70 family sugar kinase